MSSLTTLLTVFTGTAKPIPTFPSEPAVAICVLTPITSALAFRSGPPEFPRLIAASVWMTSSIGKFVGEEISRWTALTIPAVTERA
jgi:hypothetical protein